MSKAKKDELKSAVRDLLNENEELLQSIISKNVNLKFNLDEVNVLVDSVLESIITLTDEHGELFLQGFGTFKAVERKGRNGRNPSTGAELWIEAKRVPKFKPGKVFNETVENK